MLMLREEFGVRDDGYIRRKRPRPNSVRKSRTVGFGQGKKARDRTCEDCYFIVWLDEPNGCFQLERPTAAQTAIWSKEAEEHCRKNNLTKAVADAIIIASHTFSATESIRVNQQCDPDSGEICIAIQVNYGSEISQFLLEYRSCMEKWQEILPEAALCQICLTYRIR
jgi:hypothetical protein